MTTAQNTTIHLNPRDNVSIAARNLNAGTEFSVNGHSIQIGSPIRMGHKIAISPIGKDQPVYKYGQIIGYATEYIEAGQHVHSHNLVTGHLVHDFASATETPPPPKPITGRTFQGYRRPNGKAGTRNYVAVISNVNCSASVAKYVAQRFDDSKLKDYPNIDGVVALKHDTGCAMKFNGLKHQMLNRVMGGFAKHPNIGAYLLVGLGCEQATIGSLLDDQRLVQIDGVSNQRSGPPVFSMQDMGGTVKTVEAAAGKVAELLPQANDVKREPIPASEIILGTQCGGSDGNSGITANPAVGVATDMLVACGGTSILAETTEIYGAEHLLTRRAVSTEVADKLLERIQWWKWYAGIYGS